MLSFISRASVFGYAVNHWRGEHSISRSLLVNTAGGYLVCSLVLLVLSILFGTSETVVVFIVASQAAFIIFASIGTLRSAAKAIRNLSACSFIDKSSLALLLVLLMYVGYLIYLDFQRL